MGMREDLSDWLDAFCAMGDHRVGTAVDAKTIDWFADELAALGGTVERRPFRVDRYVASTSVEIDGQLVASDALYYEGVGCVRTDVPYVGSAPAMDPSAGTSAGLRDHIASARAAGADVAVVATEHPLGLLQLPNRPPVAGSKLPVVLVPGGQTDVLRGGRVRVEFDARVEQGASANVVARFGDTSGRPILLATPLSGWFTCAAERGTGIAVLLDVARRISAERPVLVVGTSAHEFLVEDARADAGRPWGLHAYLAGLDVDPALVVHCGANVALAAPAEDEGLTLAPGLSQPAGIGDTGRGLFARFHDPSLEQILQPFDRLGMTPIVNPAQLHGEGGLWAAATSAPMVSFVGISPYFHTPQDTPDRTTSPDALAQVADAIVASLDAFFSI
jgi:hypothetical protein